MRSLHGWVTLGVCTREAQPRVYLETESGCIAPDLSSRDGLIGLEIAWTWTTLKLEY